MYLFMYIYIYIYREREIHVYIHVYKYINVCMYVCIHVYMYIHSSGAKRAAACDAYECFTFVCGTLLFRKPLKTHVLHVLAHGSRVRKGFQVFSSVFKCFPEIKVLEKM